MVEREPTTTEPVQEALFGVELSPNGATEPSQYDMKADYHLERNDPEVEGPPRPETESDPALSERIRQEVETGNRRLGNLGRHSPVARGERPTAVKVGDFVPGFGPVTYTNRKAAVAFVENREDQRNHRRKR